MAKAIDKVIIEIDETGTTITEESGGIRTTKSVNPDDLKTIFSKTAFDTRELLGGLIPVSGTGIIYAGRKGDNEAVIWQVEPRRMTVTFGEGTAATNVANAPFPFFLFAFCLKTSTDKRRRENRLSFMRVFALPGPVKNEYDPVHIFKGYGNTYDDGSVCWGYNKLFVSDINDQRGVINAFYTTPFNGHLGDRIEFIRECATRGTFPLPDRPTIAKTVGDVITETTKGQSY